MDIALITGSSGLIGSEAASFYHQKGYQVIGIDNNLRQYFFGAEGSTNWKRDELTKRLNHFKPYNVDIRDYTALEKIFKEYSNSISVIIHTAAQPSHDWAAKEPLTDFSVNSIGTMNLLENYRLHCPKASFIFTSTNKVYGDTPNELPLVEQEYRFEINQDHTFFKEGINESMSIDQCKHSLFGASKVSADIFVQEYGRYFGLQTVVFRGGCLTGPGHSAAELHGFLSYLAKCALSGREYTIFGYKGKQVRDNIHCHDLVKAFWEFSQAPREGEVYNIGGGRQSNCSMLEAINLVEEFSDRKLNYTYSEDNRIGDHIWWISDCSKFRQHYPQWNQSYNIKAIIKEIVETLNQ